MGWTSGGVFFVGVARGTSQVTVSVRDVLGGIKEAQTRKGKQDAAITNVTLMKADGGSVMAWVKVPQAVMRANGSTLTETADMT